MVTYELASPPCQVGSPTSSRTEPAGTTRAPCAFLPRLNQRWAGCHRKPQQSGKGGTETHIPQKEKRTGASKNSPHIPPVCHGRGISVSPSAERGDGGSVHRSSHMEANTYLIHQGGRNKESTGSTETWGWARLPCRDGPQRKANERVGSGCSPHREVGGH